MNIMAYQLVVAKTYLTLISLRIHVLTMPEITLRNVLLRFPFEPYDVQIKYMDKVIECLQNVSIIFCSFDIER